jgi:hypothetical protein
VPETAPSDWRRFVGVSLSQRALKAAAARKTEIRHAIRVSAAVGAAFAWRPCCACRKAIGPCSPP